MRTTKSEFLRKHRGRRNAVGIRFYEEKAKPHDLLFVWHSGRRSGFDPVWDNEGVATAIKGQALSVNWTKVSAGYLYRRCRRVRAEEIVKRIKTDPNWSILLDRAVWMDHQMRTAGNAVLPF